MKTVLEAKEDITKLVNVLEEQRKKLKTKRSKALKKFNKAAKDFLRCNISNDAIYSKWQNLQDLLREMSGGTYEEQNITTGDTKE